MVVKMVFLMILLHFDVLVGTVMSHLTPEGQMAFSCSSGVIYQI